jgi:hypothetical protein
LALGGSLALLLADELALLVVVVGLALLEVALALALLVVVGLALALLVTPMVVPSWLCASADPNPLKAPHDTNRTSPKNATSANAASKLLIRHIGFSSLILRRGAFYTCASRHSNTNLPLLAREPIFSGAGEQAPAYFSHSAYIDI